MNRNLQLGQITNGVAVVCEGTVAAEAAAGDTVSLGGSGGK